MSNVNLIQQKIMQLDGGTFQSLFDEYLYKKYKLKNIQTLGVQTGTNKTTKGTPDSFVRTDDDKYILINYGSISAQPANKIKDDILSCFNNAKLSLEKDKIKKIICGHCSTNVHIEQFDSIVGAIEGVEIELIGIDTLSHDLALIYPHIAKDLLGVEIDTNQFFDIEDFVKAYDANGINAPIDCDFLFRKDEINATCKSINNNSVTILTGPSGIGKTRLALEACRKQEDGELKVYCVRSNGNLLYEDIKYYLDNPGKYLIFLDDANMVASLDNVLHTLLTLPNEYEVKVLITVRDYAKERVIALAANYSEPETIEIGRFTDEEIKEILKQNLGIINSEYLKKISEIANGNARLALLAGIRSVEEGYQAIRNAEDIFKNYYGRILADAELSKADVMMLFLIAVAGPVRRDENQLYCELKKEYVNEIDENKTIEKLYGLELIDWFKSEITKISDQSLGNYIMYYVLFEKRWISIESLIAIAFPKYRNKAVYVLMTIMDIFYSVEVTHFIEDSIISAWNNAPEEQEMAYLESFYQVDVDKSLSIIKKHIEKEEKVIFDLHSFDAYSKKNYRNIETKEIRILGGYKYTERFEEAVDLLLMYFERRPDLIMDFYFAFSGHMLYDKYSLNNKYKNEMLIMDKLGEAAKGGENYNNSILYIHVAEYALSTEITFTEEARNSRSINLVRMAIGFSNEIASLRNKIWKALGILRKMDEYHEAVNKIVSEVHINGVDEEDSKAYLQSDFDALYEYVINKDTVDYYDAKIVGRYKEAAEQIHSPIDERYLIAESNPNYMLYKLLTREHLIGKSFEEDEKKRRNEIAAEVNNYTIADYKGLFASCRFLEEVEYDRDYWALNSGLDIVFELLEANSALYIKVITEYFNENAPFRLDGHRQIRYLLNNIGYEKTYTLLSNKTYQRKDKWMSLIWECVDENDITDKIVDDFSNFIKHNLDNDNPIIPSANILKLYGERDDELKRSVIKKIVETPKLSAAFLSHGYQDEDVEILSDIFKDDFDVLSKIYMNALETSGHVDYGGKLFIKIFEHQSDIWKEYVTWVKDNIRHDGYEQKIIELIWEVETWQKCIDYAFAVLIEDKKGFLIEQPARLLFGRTEDETIFNRKKQWLLDKLHERCVDISSRIIILDVVVNVMPDWKLEFILEFLKNNKSIDDFEKIHLFPFTTSWSGSEIPLIIDKIHFLQSLKDRLNGIEYIDHRNYIEKIRRNLEKYKEKVELREYVENADYA